MESNINHTDKSSLGELLTAYYNDGMSSVEKVEFESQASSDPFLSDAMEGFNEFPQAANEIPNFNPKSTNYAWFGFGGIAIIALIGSIFYFNSTSNNVNPIENPKTTAVNSININEIESNNEIVKPLEEPKIAETKVQIQPNKKEKTEPEKSTEVNDAPEIIIEERQNIVLPKIELTKKEYKEKLNDQVKKAKTKSIGYYGFLAVDYSLIYMNEIPVKTQFSGTDASRSNKNDPSIIPDNSVSTTHYSYKDYLKSTFKYMKNRKFIPAIRNFKTILKHFPNDVNAEFYLGYCYYEIGDFNKAIPYFDHAMNNGFDFFEEDAQWFKANSLENLGDTKAAQKIYREIKNNGGFYSHKLR